MDEKVGGRSASKQEKKGGKGARAHLDRCRSSSKIRVVGRLPKPKWVSIHLRKVMNVRPLTRNTLRGFGMLDECWEELGRDGGSESRD